MGSRLLVVAVFVLAAAAAGDAFRGGGGEATRGERATERGRGEARVVASGGFVLRREGRFAADGRFLRKRVLRAGREYLGAEAIEAAFPGERQGPLDVSKLAVAPDGTLVLAVYRFPFGRRAAGALLFFRDRRLVGSFSVPPGDFGGGLAFSRAGDLVALFSHDGALRGVYDRHGRRLEEFPDRFLLGG